jgi:hypothetical protein
MNMTGVIVLDRLFFMILDMSLTGAFVIAAICSARLLLKKVPKIISYCLWSVAGFRLVFPFSIESVISLIPYRNAPIQQMQFAQPDFVTPISSNIVSNTTHAITPAAGHDPMQILTTVIAYV